VICRAISGPGEGRVFGKLGRGGGGEFAVKRKRFSVEQIVAALPNGVFTVICDSPTMLTTRFGACS
jgi:hypothetical protein